MRIPLARYGAGTVLGGTVVLAALAGLAWMAWPAAAALPVLLWVGLLMFFRDPERTADCGEHDLLSPADGTVHDVGEVDAPEFIDGRAIRIGVFMSVFDVHVNRSPAAGAVRHVSHHPGSFIDVRTREAHAANEHNFLGMELADGRRILVNQIAGLVARRIVCAVTVGDQLGRGDRFGMIKFGSRVELYLPAGDQYKVVVAVGDRVRAGRSVLARWPGPSREQEARASDTS